MNKSIIKRMLFPLAAFCTSIASLSSSAETVNGLTVLVNFSDTSPQIGSSKGLELQNMLNQVNYSDVHGNVGSLRDYYWDNSAGKTELTSTVLIVNLGKTRSSYVGSSAGKDVFDVARAKNPHTGVTNDVASLAGGPLFDLQKDILCKVVGGCTGINIQYSEFTPSINGFVNKTTAFDFSRLSTTESVFHLDWLDRLIHIGGGVPNATVIPHYSFIQILVPGTKGSTPGEGLWPRSIPSTSTEQFGLNGFALGRVGLTPLGDDMAPPSIGTIAHESGHILYNFKDLYDVQRQGMQYKKSGGTQGIITNIFDSSVWFHSRGIDRYSLMGSVGDNERNPPLINAHNRELAGWERPLDLIDAGEGEVYTLDWHADGSNPNVARSFKYCKPHSNLKECFYIEARWEMLNRAHQHAANRPTFSLDDGLMIWHTEYYENPLDFGVNDRKDGTAGLHFDVSLVQADGLRELEDPSSSPISYSGDLFKSDYNDQFNDFTTPNTRWWDGSRSGLDIRNISHVGDTMTFEIGRRPKVPLAFDYDPGDFDVRFEATGMPAWRDSYDFPVGTRVKLVVTERAGNPYRIASGATHESYEDIQHSGTQTFEVLVTHTPNIIKLANTPYVANSLNANFRLDEGVLVYYIGENGKREIIGDRLKPGTTSLIELEPLDWSNQSAYEFFIQPKPGYRLKSWLVDYMDGGLVGFGTKPTFWIDDPSLVRDANGINRPINIRVSAERLPGYLCSKDVAEDWRWDGVYNDIGSLIRYNNGVYVANTARAHAYDNRRLFDAAVNKTEFNETPAGNPDDYPDIWSKTEMCGAYSQSCSTIPEWEYGTAYAKDALVQHNGKVWKAERVNVRMGLDPSMGRVSIAHAVPGAFHELLMNYTRKLKTAKDANFDLGAASVAETTLPFPHWTLEGHCDNPANVSRATIASTEGVAQVYIANPFYTGGRWSLEPTYTGVSGTQTHYLSASTEKASYDDGMLRFRFEADYDLDGVFLNGVRQNLAADGRTAHYDFAIKWNTLPRHAHYIEIRSKKR